MSAPIDLLLEDHRNTARLLDALERQIEVFAAGGTPDYDLVAGVAEYFLDYPDLCHHPREDAIAARLLAVHPDAAAPISDIEGEHKVAHERARRFRRTVSDLLGHTDIPREAVVETALRFIAFERRHMRMEEEVFFPLAERLMGPEDWATVDAGLFRRADPLFADEIATTFKAVRERLFAWEAEDRRELAQDGVR